MTIQELSASVQDLAAGHRGEELVRAQSQTVEIARNADPVAHNADPVAHNAQPVSDLRALLRQLSALGFEGGDPDLAAASALKQTLSDLLKRSLEILAELEQLNRLAQDEDDPFAQLEQVTLVRPSEHSVTKLEDVCFAAALELNRALRELSCALGLDEMLVAAETARRKLGRALHAVVESARAAGVSEASGEPSQRRRDSELESALLVRPLYAEFRRILRRAESESSEAVLTALRYAAGALAALTASPHYAVMRASDRALLRGLRERLLEWSRSGKHQRQGLQLLDDIWTCADLLRDINRRQELRAHDAELIRELSSGAASEHAEWLPRLKGLAGLDDTLDALIAQAEKVGPENALALDVVIRLSYLA